MAYRTSRLVKARSGQGEAEFPAFRSSLPSLTLPFTYPRFRQELLHLPDSEEPDLELFSIGPRMRSNTHIGTSGWHYMHWRGLFYPAALPASGILAHYARHFHTVEINNTFYKLP